MKSEVEKACNSFVQENGYLRYLIVRQGKETRIFPSALFAQKERDSLEKALSALEQECSGHEHILLSGDKLIYTCFKNAFMFICVCDSQVSVSRVRMEMDIFMDKHCRQSGYLRKITSIFNT